MTVRRRIRLVLEALHAVAVLAAIEAGLRVTDLPTVCRLLRVRLDLESARPPAVERAVLPRRMRPAVLACGAVVTRWPAGDTCLRRCLLLGHRLRALRPVLRIGVRRVDGGEFSAHSWLEIGGRTLDPAATGYAALGSAGR
ncbi:transglutaminase superfamily protein [Prauserella shujinwangii]|uniref:Transglutaminase superfamily protein n=1 Tax=Prauserella shujinwangii TaxID=1453103 RepID=A0A2T0LQM0_9PSEU|nr:lasso peptide biosynthesis B2 protein [Prauserella shujinwangii]PRX45625.1 transglutaminase superfamily protein [Prauserella shujinwangii]